LSSVALRIHCFSSVFFLHNQAVDPAYLHRQALISLRFPQDRPNRGLFCFLAGETAATQEDYHTSRPANTGQAKIVAYASKGVRRAMKNFVITIARGFGSGGKQIGLKIANDLNIRLMDKELLQLASIDSGINEELFALADEKFNRRLLMQVPDREHYGNVLTPENNKFVSDMNLFNYQVKILKMLAETESFIVMGKAANFVLRDLPNVVSVCIQAPFDSCVQSIMDRSGMTAGEAGRAVRRTDKYRSDYHKYYTGENWKEPIGYDLCLNSATLGRDHCVEIIKQAVVQKLGIDLSEKA